MQVIGKLGEAKQLVKVHKMHKSVTALLEDLGKKCKKALFMMSTLQWSLFFGLTAEFTYAVVRCLQDILLFIL